METKTCKACKTKKPIEDFYVAGYYRENICKQCRREVQNKRYREKSRKLAEERKKQIRRYRAPGEQTLCWDCQNATGHCSWSSVDNSKPERPIRFELPEGAVAIHVEGYLRGRNDKSDTYCVLSCPEFVPDEKREVPREYGI